MIVIYRGSSAVLRVESALGTIELEHHQPLFAVSRYDLVGPVLHTMLGAHPTFAEAVANAEAWSRSTGMEVVDCTHESTATADIEAMMQPLA
ncbi:hypothetical protein ACTOV4_23560 [Brucella sp. C7-11G]